MTSRISSAVLLALVLGAGAGLAQAESTVSADAGHAGFKQGHPQHRARGEHRPRESYTEESTRKMADGKVFKRKVEQKVGEGSFSRKELLTNPEGKTATHTVSASFDKDKQSWSRKAEGTGFDGKSWSRSQEGQGKRDQGRRDHHDRHHDGAPAEPKKAG